jgi:predicted nucleic acid-binding protein
VIRYFDASALVRRFVEEEGSDLVAMLLRDPSATSWFTQVEILSAGASRVQQGDMAPADHQRTAVALSRDMEGLVVLEMTGEVVSSRERLLLRHALRAGDAVQVASCMVLRDRAEVPVEFVTYDVRSNQAARREGLTVIGP